MITQEMVSYIKTLEAQGLAREAIEKNLLSAGWDHADVAEAFSAIDGLAIPQAPAHSVPAAPSTGLVMPAPRHRSHVATFAAVFAIVLLAGGSAYAYFFKIGPFSRAPYGENNLITGILSKGSKIETSAYAMSASFAMGPRDADAEPFEIEVADQGLFLTQYENDVLRARDAAEILRELKYAGKYPSALSKLLNSNSYFSGGLKDPATSEPYSYVLSPDGKNFKLTIVFETTHAIKSIRESFDFDPATTSISGETVVFTKDSPAYFYLPSEPKKPGLAELSGYLREFPGELSADATVSGKTDWRKEGMADWTFNFDANGDFGDLAYKINFDALKKGENYYFRINNIPSLFLGELSDAKGQWISISSKKEDAEENDYGFDPFSMIASELADKEDEYKKNRAEFVSLLKAAARFADEERLVAFKSKPEKDEVDGRSLYKYSISMNKDAVLPFYRKVLAEAEKYENTREIFEDPGLLEYLESPEFSKTFDYYSANTFLSLWVDKDGFPAILEYRFRLVPPDEAEQLKDRQGNLIFTLKVSDINKPLAIEAPADAKKFEDIIGPSIRASEEEGNNATIKAYLASLRASAELYYDEHGSYGKAVSGSCETAGSMFKDAAIWPMLETISDIAKENSLSAPVCFGTGKAWAASSELIETAGETGYWCVDSAGSSRKIAKPLASASCR